MMERFEKHIVRSTIGAGAATFFFGFGAAAVFNLYLLAINSPEITHLRTILSFRSAIYGDGMILPIIDMIAVWTILQNREFRTRTLLTLAIFIGVAITIYFHVDQATHDLVNWAMPQPWHWNLLGLWHAIYMLTVSTLLSFYFLLSVVYVYRKNHIPWTLVVSILGIVAFFILLGTDYL